MMSFRVSFKLMALFLVQSFQGKKNKKEKKKMMSRAIRNLL